MAKPHITLSLLSAQDIQRFKTKFTEGDIGECWLWNGTPGKRIRGEPGYGLFKARRRMFRAPRIAFYLGRNTDPGQMLVCHSCDNPPCVNPTHLFLGTNRDNQIDARDKGKLNPPSGDHHYSRTHPEKVAREERHSTKTKPEAFLRHRGETHEAAKLTENMVREIRETYTEGYDTMKEIADAYGMNPATICDIINRKKWKHVQ